MGRSVPVPDWSRKTHWWSQCLPTNAINRTDDDEDDYDQPDETEVDADDRHVLWSRAKNGAGAGAGDWPLKG
ncbi:GD22175 [Drosophila simulans]|uniref:GD22175 n=1 Tax=Drosophila simulans TaxID=7240 RepID=B4QAE1_DROSI|nr:GD22175 [Drosophila simulans]